MERLILLGIVGIGAGLAYLVNQKRIIVVPKEREEAVPLPPPTPTKDEMRKVMQHLGKKSGVARRRK